MAFRLLLFLLSFLPSVRLVLIFLVVFLVVKMMLTWGRTYRNLPPGPRGLQLLGACLRISRDPLSALAAMSRKYGSIFSLYIGPRLTVVITDPELVREAYGKNGHVTGERDIVTLDWLDTSGAIVSCSGNDVKPLRRFLLRNLREFGMGKQTSVEMAMNEARYLGDAILREKGQVFDARDLLQMATSNIICLFCFGQRFDYDSPKYRSLIDSLRLVSHIRCLSVTRELPFLFLAPRFKEFRRGAVVYDRMIKQLVKDHKATFDPKRLRDLTDKLICETCVKKPDSRSVTFGEDRIYRMLMDMFGAGADSTSSTLQFGIWQVASNPDVQESIRSEILTEIGTERPPDWNDRHRLPYTQASVNEILRLSHPAPLSLIHRTTAPIELAGYDIPPGTELITPIMAMNMDPNRWQDAKRFQPERFLSKDGKNVVLPKEFMPFSTGSRMCIGEGLARMEIFIFLSTLLQRFTFDLPPEVPKSCEPHLGFFLLYPTQLRIRANLIDTRIGCSTAAPANSS